MAKSVYRTPALVLLALLATAQLASAAGYITYTATLKGSHERPTKVGTKANGKSELWVYDEHAKLSVSLNNINKLQVVHVHFTGVNSSNPLGSGGPVLWVLPFAPFQNLNPALTVKGTLSAAITFNGTDLQGNVYPANANATTKFDIFKRWAENNQLYINAHTATYPAGEIRGNFAKKK